MISCNTLLFKKLVVFMICSDHSNYDSVAKL